MRNVASALLLLGACGWSADTIALRSVAATVAIESVCDYAQTMRASDDGRWRDPSYYETNALLGPKPSAALLTTALALDLLVATTTAFAEKMPGWIRGSALGGEGAAETRAVVSNWRNGESVCGL